MGMFVRKLDECEEFVSGDKALLREIFNPLKEDMAVRYSLAHAVVPPGNSTSPHVLATAEVYYILEGRGTVTMDGKNREVYPEDTVYIPPGTTQSVRNTGAGDLKFICLVDPAWRPSDETIL